MAKSVNKVILVGNLGKDPEVRKLENGATVAQFSLATSESYRDRNTNEIRTTTDWHNIVLWRGLAEVAEKYLHKGMQIYVEGKIRNRSYQDKDGNTKYITEIVGDNLVMMSKGPEQQTNSDSSHQEMGNAPFSGDMSTEDDLPF